MRKWLVTVLALCFPAAADAAPPIEAYGELPTIRSMALSPDGAHVAYLLFQDGKEMMAVYELGKGVAGAVSTEGMKANWVSFAGPRHVIINASETMRIIGYGGRDEYSAAFSYSLDDRKVIQLLARTDHLYPAQTGLGRVLGRSADEPRVFMPAFMGEAGDPAYDLLSVDLDSGFGRTIASGLSYTQDWIVDSNGVVLAREDYNEKEDKYQLLTRRDGEWRKILEYSDQKLFPFTLNGVKADGSALIIIDRAEESEFRTVRELSFEGEISPPIFERNDSEAERLIIDDNRAVIGAEFSGFYPGYDFYDAELEKAVAGVQDYFAGNSASLVSWTDDFSKLLFYVEGTDAAGDYYIFDPAHSAIERIAQSRPDISADDIGEVLTINYKARDGLTIPALLTMPTSGETTGLPLIVMPHGGPEAYDAVGFDWLAQFFASRGYLVLQPNFRGSTGFGVAFRDAGRGEWGGKMQDDITDGVNALINSGRADPNRICIVGGSYGGYAALAGGAFTPDLYKCVAAIAPVADVPAMLTDAKRENGRDSLVLDYWKEVIGDPKADREHLKAISPANHADAFKAPVLLIHGKDDFVVPIDQSERMESALKSAGKEVEFIRLKGEDHHLSKSETRLATLKALDAFVSKHIGRR